MYNFVITILKVSGIMYLTIQGFYHVLHMAICKIYITLSHCQKSAVNHVFKRYASTCTMISSKLLAQTVTAISFPFLYRAIWPGSITLYFYKGCYYGQLMVMATMSIAFPGHYNNSSLLSNAFFEGVLHKPCQRTQCLQTTCKKFIFHLFAILCFCGSTGFIMKVLGTWMFIVILQNLPQSGMH